MAFKGYPFLNEDEVQKTLKSVFELKEHWTHRGKAVFDVPFYTLGAAGYQDVQTYGETEKYKALFKEKNPILKENFSWLYDKTKTFLEGIYKAPFDYYPEESGYPGFHVFLEDDFFEISIASRHVDLQWKNIDWHGKEYDMTKTISFTCYLKLPQQGAGLNVWKSTYLDLQEYDLEKKEEILHEEGYETLSFDVGEMAIHTGLEFHQIAPFEEIQEGDERISYQGHAIWVEDKYVIHW